METVSLYRMGHRFTGTTLSQKTSKAPSRFIARRVRPIGVSIVRHRVRGYQNQCELFISGDDGEFVKFCVHNAAALYAFLQVTAFVYMEVFEPHEDHSSK